MNLLNLPDWNIEHVEDSARDYRVHATYGPEPSQCIHCGKGTLFAGKLYRHGTREQLWFEDGSHGHVSAAKRSELTRRLKQRLTAK